MQAIVKLLGNLPNATLRTHYIHHCAELLSQGNARMMLRLEEDLRVQVRGERWHGRSQKWQTNSDRTLLEESEAQLLRLYLHAPQHREAIMDALESRDLEFSFSHHRFLWRQILELEEGVENRGQGSGVRGQGSDNSEFGIQHSTFNIHNSSALHAPTDLISLLQDRCTDFPSEMAQIYPLFNLDEKQSEISCGHH